MELRHGEVAAKPQRQRLARLGLAAATVLAAGLLYVGTHQLSASPDKGSLKTASAMETSPKRGGCELVFSEAVKADLERRMERAVSPRLGQIKSQLGVGSGAYFTVSIGVDRSGRPMIEDAWASGSGREVDATGVVRTLGLSFEGLTLAAPADGYRCSYTLSNRI